MNSPLLRCGLLVVICSPFAGAADAVRLKPVPFPKVQIRDAFWSPRLATNAAQTVESNLTQCERTGRIDNFAIAGKLKEGKFKGLLFDDSDVYKVLEGVAYTLHNKPDAALEKRADAVIDVIAAAQQPDGYLNTFYTLADPKGRWNHTQYGHELYCAGHLFEAAVAYDQATGKKKLLEVATKFADHINKRFGPNPGQKFDCCGHEEIELALVKLHLHTGQKRYLSLAKFFLDARGVEKGRKLFGEYAQDHKPVREQREVGGHAVRAMYLYTAMADVAALTGDKTLMEPLDAIWKDVVERKMYLTGGIGPSAHNEGFTVPYDLPNLSAYAETCAAVGMALWNHRMFLATGDGRYADIMEREVYNGLLSGVSLAGDKFFYVNPLESKGNHHRVPWFDCSCCPTNVVRYLPAMGERVYATKGNNIYTVLYVAGDAEVEIPAGKVAIKQKSNYPWEGDVRLTVHPEKPATFALNLRAPGWLSDAPTLKINGEKVPVKVAGGYARIEREWKAGDEVVWNMPMPVRRVYADPKVKNNVGRVALMRGPVVFCLEGCDQPGGTCRDLILPREAKIEASFEKDLLRGVAVLKGEAISNFADSATATFRAVPYCVWDNRKPGEMVVWIAETPDALGREGQHSAEVEGATILASHCWTLDSLAAVADKAQPKSSGDHDVGRMTWWDHKGTDEWLSVRYLAGTKRSKVSVYWFDDTGKGQCRVPESWRLVYKDGDAWKPVKLKDGSKFGTAADAYNVAEFEPAEAVEFRVEAKLRKDFSGGVLRLKLE